MTDEQTSEILLEVDAISLSFGGVHALVDVSFDIRKGEVRSIIGPNGAGKSSMLNVINGFYHPQQGTITYQGQARKQMRPHDAAAGGIARSFRTSRFSGHEHSGQHHDWSQHTYEQVPFLAGIAYRSGAA